MVIHARPEALRHPAYRALQPRIIERDEAAALLAHEVMMVLAAGQDALEPGLVAVDRDPLYEPVLHEQIEGAVDRGEPRPSPLGAERLLDLDRAQRAGLIGQQIDHPVAGLGLTEAGLAKLEADLITPAQGHMPRVTRLTREVIMRIILTAW